jgi:aerobic-type carbon monoxide dehydrogenase small subunit (CoxS/CutS family)
MIDNVTIIINGVPHPVAADITLAAALLNLGVTAFRRDLTGNARGPVCGIGTCFECRVTVDGVTNVRACLELVRDGMSVQSG